MRSTARLRLARQDPDVHHDLITSAVLHAEGLSSRQIASLVEDRVLERIIRGLYRLAGTQSPVQDVAAALQRHPRAIASHVSALFLHGLDVEPPPEPHLTLPPGSSSGNRLGVLHRSPMDDVDRTRRHRLPVTSVARSIVDAAEMLDVEALARVVNEALTGRITTLIRILDVAERVELAPGRVGGGRLRAVLVTWTEEIRPESVAEAAAIRIIRLSGLPTPTTQYVIEDEDGGFIARVDMAWPDQKVAREYDSVRWHRVDRIEADEWRRQRIEALGWTVEPVYRHHLLPGARDWLRELRAQLARPEHRAS